MNYLLGFPSFFLFLIYKLWQTIILIKKCMYLSLSLLCVSSIDFSYPMKDLLTQKADKY